jgi:hypothetical protein
MLNPHLGIGGALQYLIENFKDVLKPIGDVNLF